MRWLTATVFSAVTFLFFLMFCRYQIIYHEQQQLFQYHFAYFIRTIEFPGGLALYINCFLLQFFYYPWIGALIFTLIVLSVYAAVRNIFITFGISDRNGFLSLFPAVAFCIILYDYQSDPSYLLTFTGSLLFFTFGIRITRRMFRFFAGCIGLILLYFFSPASMLLAASLMIIHELFIIGGRSKYIISAVYLSITGIFPYLAWSAVYTAPLSEAYFSGFPFRETGLAGLLLCFAWLFVPAALLMTGIFPSMKAKKTKNRWVHILTLSVLFAFAGSGLYHVSDKRVILLLRMNEALSREEWGEVLHLSQKYPTSNRLVSYFTNIALHKTGQMLESFFNYRQTGYSGLFIDWRRDYLTAMVGSEIFYQIGYINEAAHWAFEALTASNSGENPRLLKRLIQTAIINEDYAVAAKYLHILRSTLFYRKWANKHLSPLSDVEQIADLPWVSEKRSRWIKNDFLSGREAPANLPLFFKEHPESKMAFEYLMMFYLLTKNMNEFMNHIGRVFNYDYTSMPTIFEEAILVHLNMTDADRETYMKYPIKKESYERFYDYSEMYQNYSSNPQLQKRELLKKFGNTYWYYYHFYQPPEKLPE